MMHEYITDMGDLLVPDEVLKHLMALQPDMEEEDVIDGFVTGCVNFNQEPKIGSMIYLKIYYNNRIFYCTSPSFCSNI